MSLKWREQRSPSEFFTPPDYLVDIINISLNKSLFHSDDIIRDYSQNGLSLKQISSKIVHSKSAVASKLRSNDVVLRCPHFSHGNPSQLRFGFRSDSNRVVPHRGEQHIIGIVLDLRSDGMTYRDIAIRLANLKIPSKNGSFKWHPMMVKRIVDFNSQKSNVSN